MHTRVRYLPFLCIMAALLGSCARESKLADGLYARIETNKGTLYAFLEYEYAPLAVANFVSLAEVRTIPSSASRSTTASNSTAMKRISSSREGIRAVTAQAAPATFSPMNSTTGSSMTLPACSAWRTTHPTRMAANST